MQKAINRFWDWLFHPSIRWYHFPKGKAAWFRYPSPGNSINPQKVVDYKTPYQYSDYNVRYKSPTPTMLKMQQMQLFADGPGLSTNDKLVDQGFLNQNDINSTQKVQAAKQKYLDLYGFPAEQRVYRNDMGITIPQATRQSIRQSIENEYKNQRIIVQKRGNAAVNRQAIQSPEIVDIESLDMYTMPHLQQARLQLSYKVDRKANQNAERGFIDIKQGDRKFWKALDNSNDARNIQNVQRAVGDANPNDFSIKNTIIELKKNSDGKVVDVLPHTKSL